MATIRRSLAERNRAAIAADPYEGQYDPVSAPAPAPEPEAATASETPQAPRTAPKKRAAATTATKPAAPAKRASDVARQGVYLSADAYDDARAAYLGDWLAGGSIDTFAGWIAAAIDAYAARTPEQRTYAPRTRSADRQGGPRSWSIPLDTIASMRAAIAADQKAGRWPSDSAWCAAAIAAAVEATRARDGGLPAAPDGLMPKRLTR